MPALPSMRSLPSLPSLRRTAAAAAVLLLTVGCSATKPGNDTASASPAVSASKDGKLHLPSDLPTSWDELKKWKLKDWDTWASKHVFHNPVVRDLWNPDKMGSAQPGQPQAPATPPSATTGNGSGDNGVTDPDPAPVQAAAVPRPYTKYPASGKVFFTAPEGYGQCSATVVADPQHPGKSNLVWTAGHCVDPGKGGDWYKNIIFVPAYNNSGAAAPGKKASTTDVAPLGQWWADQVITSPQWQAEGDHVGNSASQYDFAVLRVHNPDGNGKSLEETVGTAMPVWFDAPRAQLSVSAWGYPAAPPFDGQQLDRCDGGHPVRLSFDPQRPAMLTIGCTMTAGASGGGWFATMPDGRQALVSNTSIGTLNHTTLSGPYLESVAKQAYEYLSQKS